MRVPATFGDFNCIHRILLTVRDESGIVRPLIEILIEVLVAGPWPPPFGRVNVDQEQRPSPFGSPWARNASALMKDSVNDHTPS